MSGNVFVAAAAVLWGLWPLWVHGLPTLPAAATAFGAAGLVGLPVAVWQGRGRRRTGRDWSLLVALALLDAANIWLYFQALAQGAVAPAVLAHYLAPVFVALAAPRVLGEPRSPRTPLALALALAGTATLFVGTSGGDGGAAGAAMAYGAGSAVFYASMVLLSKRLGGAFADGELLCYHIILSAAVLGAIGGVALEWRPALGGLVSALLASWLYYAGLRRIPAERAGLLAYLEPPSAVLVGWLAWGERPGAGAAIGGLMILGAGILGSMRAER